MLGLLALAAVASAAPIGEKCAAALAAVEGYHCVENPNGVALAPDQARSEQLALYSLAGEHRFALHFGRPVARYALIDWDGKAPVGVHQKALNRAGFRRTLPWLSRAAYSEALKMATVQMVDAMAASSGLDEAGKAELLEVELHRAEQGLTRYEMDLFEATVVPHEIGHGWYTEAFWPGFVMDRLGHYGSPSPDWLDETASILMESGDSADQRRHHFHEAYLGGSDRVSLEELLDLRQFLLREHPEAAANAASAAAASKDSGPSVTVIQHEPGSGPRSGALYYEQGRMFADFLLDRSGDQAIFGSIAGAFAAGKSMDEWLAGHGDAHSLADSVANLDLQWREWLAARFGPPGRR